MKRTLIYKRTHKGDPDNEGRFGINDCMGSVRCRDFDSVIGIGGIGGQARAHGIDGKVNWIGIGSRKGPTTGKNRGPLVTFDHFVIFEEKGQNFRAVAPNLAQRMYSKNVRVLSRFDHAEQGEIDRILRMAKSAPPSAGIAAIEGVRCASRRSRPDIK